MPDSEWQSLANRRLYFYEEGEDHGGIVGAGFFRSLRGCICNLEVTYPGVQSPVRPVFPIDRHWVSPFFMWRCL